MRLTWILYPTSRLLLPLLAATMLVTLAGCDNAKEPPAPAQPSAEDQASSDEPSGTPVVEDRVLKVTPAMGVGDYLPPLEGGRLEIAPPADWKIMGRRSGFVTRFYETDPRALPRIAVTAEPTPFEDLADVTEDNVKQFAQRLAERLESEGTKLLEPVLPMVIGPNAAARYVTAAKADGLVIERQVLVTVADGQMYTVDLQVLPRTIKQHKEAGYAVLAGMKFETP